MTALRPMIVNEVLCFITKKLGRLAVRQLNSTLYDFYSGDVLYAAKETLLDTVQSSKMEIPPKVIRRRCDSTEIAVAKIHLNIDALFTTIRYLDQKKTIDRLSLFVVADPDMIPSARLLEGDMVAVINKLKKIEHKCSTLQSELEATRLIISQNSAGAAHGKFQPGHNKAINKMGQGRRNWLHRSVI